MAERLLELKNVSLAFGGLKCVSGLDLHVDEGEIVSVIGPNGAGKTTLFNLITGIYSPDAGDISARRPEHRRPAAAPDHAARHRAHVPDAAAVPEHDRQGERDDGRVRAHEGRPLPLDAPDARACAARSGRSPSSPTRSSPSSAQRLMGYRWNQPAYSLSYANRRRLEIARATATNPKILLLDEPAAGMNPVETHEITELIGKLRTEGGYTILVIEHDMHVVEGISDRVDRARPRDEDRRGQVRRGGDERQGDRGLPRARDGRHQVSTTGAPLLELDAVDTYYGQIHILQGLSIRIEPGELVCLLGGNASGKSTTLKTILGIVRPRNGTRVDRRRGRDEAADELPDRPRARDRAREPAAVRADDGAREPRDGRVPPRRRRQGGLRPRLRPVPAAARAALAAGRDALGRRAADGRDGARADVAGRSCC